MKVYSSSIQKDVFGCRWVYAIKVVSSDEVDHLKTVLVAKEYTQIYGLNYNDTFSLVVKMATVCLFLVMTVICHSPLHQ